MEDGGWRMECNIRGREGARNEEAMLTWKVSAKAFAMERKTPSMEKL
jgi:hypothetical protein